MTIPADNRATLTPEQAAEIRWRYAQSDHPTQADLAHEYGVHPSQVSRLVRGLSFASANGPVFPHRPLNTSSPE